jgi:hypothetical protein
MRGLSQSARDLLYLGSLSVQTVKDLARIMTESPTNMLWCPDRPRYEEKDTCSPNSLSVLRIAHRWLETCLEITIAEEEKAQSFLLDY